MSLVRMYPEGSFRNGLCIVMLSFDHVHTTLTKMPSNKVVASVAGACVIPKGIITVMLTSSIICNALVDICRSQEHSLLNDPQSNQSIVFSV